MSVNDHYNHINSNPKDSIIKVDNLIRTFGKRRVLDGISIDIKKGETFVIMGGSGCGKSTLLRHLVGALKPDSGKISLFGKDITVMNEDQMDHMRKNFGILFQSGALLDYLTVEENVALPLKEHTKLDPNVIKIMVKMKLGLVGLRGFENHLPSEISGGMKKRAGLARAIAMDPAIVFYDEPTAGLDPIATAVIDKLIIDLSKKLSITSVVVTHDMASVFRIADRAAMLYEGKVLETGTIAEIRNSKNPMVQQFINGQAEGPINYFGKEEDFLDGLL